MLRLQQRRNGTVFAENLLDLTTAQANMNIFRQNGWSAGYVMPGSDEVAVYVSPDGAIVAAFTLAK